jgi:SpoIID/LytB domain protein
MTNLNKHIQKLINSTLVIIFLISISILPSNARTISDVQQEIERKKAELTQVETEVSTLEEVLEQQKDDLSKATGRRATAYAQINLNKSEVELVRKKIEDLVNNEQLKELEREQRIIVQNRIISESYLNWKQDNIMRNILSDQSNNPIKVLTYQTMVADSEQKGIEEIQLELVQIKQDIVESEELKQTYEVRITELEKQVAEIQKEITELDQKVRANEGDIGNYRAQMGSIKMQIDQLTAEQEEIQRREAGLLGEANNGGTKPLIKGEYHFQGIGREVYQGHGVGMSQFGALGAALKGWDYKRILEFYYPGAKVGVYKRDSINVQGYGSMSLEDYVAGAGEIPDYSCEDLDIPFDRNNIWKCWPEEAIKAQAVAFRTYGLYKTGGGESICTTAHCQVYKGGENKRWAAEETEHEVVLFEGQPISAFYSSDNNNGWGTANNETVWSNFSGTGVPRQYLRAVNDSGITFRWAYTDWKWRTNSYAIDEIDDMLYWSGNSSKASASYRGFVKGLHDRTGSLRKIEMERDPSGRVARVKLTGSKSSEYIAGWLFKSIWNIWIDSERPSGEKDFIYSLTYYMILVE